MSWNTRLPHPFRDRKRRVELHTLGDVRDYMIKLKTRFNLPYWQHAGKLLLEAEESGDTAELAQQLILAMLHDGTFDLTFDRVARAA